MKRIFTDLILTISTRKTGHIGYNCELQLEEAQVGTNYGLSQAIVYQANGFDKLYMATIKYDDNMVFGPNLVGCCVNGDSILINHISSNGTRWYMQMNLRQSFEKININGTSIEVKKTYEKTETSYNMIFEEAKNVEKHLYKCPACWTKYITRFVEIDQCPICGREKE